ncbi:hypothetical protein, partial [Salmonella sp. s51228]|uniref:hypothetical protein n=1 Tax=Salmonella sp. s51228 TaxID=3159652 RepID=UPI00397EA096
MQTLAVKAKQGGSKIPVKVYDAGEATALAQFVPKEIGKVDVEVLCAGEDLPGGLFSIQIVDMEKISIQGKLPPAIQAGTEITLPVKHKGAGAGKLQVRIIDGKDH